MQKVRRTSRKLALKLSCVDTPWVPAYEPGVSSPFPSSTLPTAVGLSNTMAAGTSSVRTPIHEGKGPTEDEDEEDDYDEIGMSQLGNAPFPTQFEEQVLKTTFRHMRDNDFNIVSNDTYIVIAGY